MSSLDTLIQDLVIANRILAKEDVVDAYGHISVRHPDNPNRFLIARSVSPAGRARALGRFSAAVREGMQLYMERQPGDLPSTLEGQQGRRELPGPGASRGPGG